ncbi:MAG: carbohydrate kinase family protein [Granulosicoccus sp.]
MTATTIIAIGELLVEFVSHQEGCKLLNLAEYSGPYPSGAPAICIDQAARLGAITQIFGTVGDDNFGKALTDRLIANGVGTTGISSVAGKTTAVAFVSYFRDGERTFIFHLNNTAADTIDARSITLPDTPVIMHVSGSSLGNPHLRNTIESVAAQVIEHGGKISCDPNARPELMGDPVVMTSLRQLIEHSSFLFPSDDDLAHLYPDKSISEAIDTLLAGGADTIALTQGKRGSTIFSHSHKPLILAGHKVDETDPTGAGDCYCGTFLAMAVAGNPIEKCGQYANAAGAMAVTKRGPMEGNSFLSDIETFLRNNPAIARDK